MLGVAACRVNAVYARIPGGGVYAKYTAQVWLGFATRGQFTMKIAYHSATTHVMAMLLRKEMVWMPDILPKGAHGHQDVKAALCSHHM
jgi:hypothetical protein